MRKFTILKIASFYFFVVLSLSATLAYAEASEKKFSPYSPNEILIDSQAFYNNLKLIQGMFPKELKILAVMKSNAYGYGISNLANAAKEAGVQYYGVTENSEMLALRDKGITSTIIRLREATPSEIEDVLKNSDKYGEINEMVGNLALAEEMNELAKEYSKVVPIHINLNSAGMGRSGIDLDSSKEKNELKEILALKNLKVVGIMSHFPNSGANDLSASKEGVKKFKAQSDWVIKEGELNRDDLLLHMAETSAALRIPDSRFDMVRLGSLIYGEKIQKESPAELKPLLTFKSHVAAKMHFSKGDTIGYGSRVTLKRDSVLANIPFGKANGVPYNLKEVLIAGKRFETVGVMSMNTTMVDITNYADDINIDDEVVIIGKQSGKLGLNEITLKEITDNSSLTSQSMRSYFIGSLNHLIRKEGKY